MYATIIYRLVLIALALTATATPVNKTVKSTVYGSDVETRDSHDHFKIHIWNNCPFEKEFAIFRSNDDYTESQYSPGITLQQGQDHIFHPRFHETSMRLSGHAEWGASGQYAAQALFEFGYSTYAGQEGTAYDVSIMPGSDGDIGVGVWPKNGACESKICWPWDCAPSQGWSNPDQYEIGSPADTVCYQGKTDFKVVFCP